MLALTEFLASPTKSWPKWGVNVDAGEMQRIEIGGDKTLQRLKNKHRGEIKISMADEKEGPIFVVRQESSYILESLGSQVAAEASGFVVTREMLKIKGEDTPPERVKIDSPGIKIDLSAGDVVEDHVEVVNPVERNYVAIVAPLAAGMEPLNPALAAAPPEAAPSGKYDAAPDLCDFHGR